LLDSDNDRIIDIDDIDDDGDGRIDSVDDCTPGLINWISNLSSDSDADGCQDIGEDNDDDNDLIIDILDAFPNDPSENTDTDGDGIGDNSDTDDDGDGWSDSMELICETDPMLSQSVPLDTDSDLQCDLVDTDDDNDDFSDIEDWSPLDSSEWLDTDNDGIGDNADTDKDGDGISNIDEIKFGTNPLLADTDNDGYLDSEDIFPTDISEWLDSDGDGKGDNSDSHPDFKYFQNDFQFVLSILVCISILIIIGFLGVIGLRKNKSDGIEEQEEKPVIEVDYAYEGMPVVNDTENQEVTDVESADEKTMTEDVRNTSHIDALLDELPTPPKPQKITPPEGTPINEYGQKVWADETGQVWCQNSDESILRHDAATGGWVQYHNY
jgi:hypothetical protein